MNKLDHVVTSNINDCNDQNNDAIDNETKLDNSSSSLSGGTSDPFTSKYCIPPRRKET